MKRHSPWLALAWLWTGCFDPLYSEGLPPTFSERYAVCCVQGLVDTCVCSVASQCGPQFRACARGGCVEPAGASCSGGGSSDGGIEPSQDAGSGWADGGIEPPHLDAGVPDAGVPVDAGQPDAGQPDAGQPDAGRPEDAGTPPDAGPFREPVYEPCCEASGLVGTCDCPGGVCRQAPFTACPGRRCLPGTLTGHCG